MREKEVWNRALDYDYEGPRAEGDRALYDLLLLDNVAQNGGLLHGIQVLDEDELAAAVAGYRWFGLDALADGIVSIATDAADIDVDDPESVDAQSELEERADELFFGEHGSDLLGRAFNKKLADQPDAFADPAPVSP
jgi:hypothetical protein